MVARSTFNRCSQVEHDFVVGGSFAPSLENFVPELHSEFGFSLRERLKAVIEGKTCSWEKMSC